MAVREVCGLVGAGVEIFGEVGVVEVVGDKVRDLLGVERG